MLERDRIIEIVVALIVVFAMIGTMLYIGSAYGGDDGTLPPDGGEMLVAAIVGFIFLATAIGVVLAFVRNDDEDADAEVDAEANSTA